MNKMDLNPAPYDYDENPKRFRANVQAVNKYSLVGDLHEKVAERIASENLRPILDIGCGEGRLTSLLQARGIPFIGLDLSLTMLNKALQPCIRGNAVNLPFLPGTFGSTTMLYMLYHLPNPKEAIAESYRVLRNDGLFIAAAPGRYNDPELKSVLPPFSPSTFDAEDASDIIGKYFSHIEIETWDGPFVRLPDRDAIILYLKGQGLEEKDAIEVTDKLKTPLILTKHGALIYGYKEVKS